MPLVGNTGPLNQPGTPVRWYEPDPPEWYEKDDDDEE